ncbi:hypothetical protein BGZ99_004934 [Dissophora globulifera]|uniref:Uncharacterized protein n=1 Tax=Dissophora globulifera TaxID=979702 RepID=A0A9P6RGR0_9FUNG|nr:hypothetical protein BGZ99_004934 [Dissophora globulifera]
MASDFIINLSLSPSHHDLLDFEVESEYEDVSLDDALVFCEHRADIISNSSVAPSSTFLDLGEAINLMSNSRTNTCSEGEIVENKLEQSNGMHGDAPGDSKVECISQPSSSSVHSTSATTSQDSGDSKCTNDSRASAFQGVSKVKVRTASFSEAAPVTKRSAKAPKTLASSPSRPSRSMSPSPSISVSSRASVSPAPRRHRSNQPLDPHVVCAVVDGDAEITDHETARVPVTPKPAFKNNTIRCGAQDERWHAAKTADANGCKRISLDDGEIWESTDEDLRERGLFTKRFRLARGGRVSRPPRNPNPPGSDTDIPPEVLVVFAAQENYALMRQLSLERQAHLQAQRQINLLLVECNELKRRLDSAQRSIDILKLESEILRETGHGAQHPFEYQDQHQQLLFRQIQRRQMSQGAATETENYALLLRALEMYKNETSALENTSVSRAPLPPQQQQQQQQRRGE